jgi:hypothetical protein
MSGRFHLVLVLVLILKTGFDVFSFQVSSFQRSVLRLIWSLTFPCKFGHLDPEFEPQSFLQCF